MNKRKIFISTGLLLLSFFVVILFTMMHSQKNDTGTIGRSFIEDTSSVSFWVTGDAMMHMPQYNAAKNIETGITEFDSCYTFIRPIIGEADIRIVNFETTLAGKPYSGYPQFSADPNFADALVRAGFNFFVFANNHTCDRGKKGIEGNIKYADSAKLYNAGIYRNHAERQKKYPVFIEKNNMKIAVLNCTYGTNGIPCPRPLVINYIDTAEISIDIAKAKKQNADAIIMFIHWGEEYQHKRNINQKNIANFLLSKGVDVIVGSHPHVVQPVEFTHVDSCLKDRLIIWSLGNFISNQKDPLTDAGLIMGFTLKKSRFGRPDITDVKCVPFYRYKCSKKPGYFLMPSILTEKNLTKLIPSSEDQEDFKSVIADTRKKVKADNRIKEYGEN